MEERNVGNWERPLRIVGGAALMTMSMTGEKARLTRWAEGLTGTELLWTGLAGYCPMNKMLGRDSFHDIEAGNEGLTRLVPFVRRGGD